MKDYNVQHIPLDQIDKNRLNPSERGSIADTKLLSESITERGLYYPILVNKKDDGRFEIIEGHRRFSVYRAKSSSNPDFAAIPALVVSVGEQYVTGIFRDINETSRKLTGKQWLEVSALGGALADMPSRLRPAIKALSALFEPDEVQRMSLRQGPSVHGLGRRVATFANYDPEDPKQLRRVVAWLVNSGDSVNIRVAMHSGQGNAEARKAISDERRLDGREYNDGFIVAAVPKRQRLAA
jgi:hypothetical protein